MRKDTLFESTLNSSVLVGNLLVPASALETHLGKFASLLTVWKHDAKYQIALWGSSTKLRYAGKLFLLSSQHQLEYVEFEDVGILNPDGGQFVTSGGSRAYVGPKFTETSDAFDIVAFDFTEPASDYPMLFENAFEFTSVPPDIRNTEILAFIIAGYPSKDQKYEVEEKNHLGTLRRVLVAEPDSQPSDPALLRLKFSRMLDFDPDGLSGGPVFVIQLVNGQPQAFLGGMIVRAGKSHCYVLKSGFVRDFLDSFI